MLHSHACNDVVIHSFIYLCSHAFSQSFMPSHSCPGDEHRGVSLENLFIYVIIEGIVYDAACAGLPCSLGHVRGIALFIHLCNPTRSFSHALFHSRAVSACARHRHATNLFIYVFALQSMIVQQHLPLHSYAQAKPRNAVGIYLCNFIYVTSPSCLALPAGSRTLRKGP